MFVLPGQLAADTPALILIQGAPGAEEYEKPFTEWTTRWQAAAQRGGVVLHTITPNDEAETNAKTRLQTLLAAQPKESPAELWLVLLGHGTFDGKEAKFNLEGPDVSADELAEWLKPFDRPVILINCSSSSAPFLKLATSNIVVVTATKSGYEMNYSRFGDYLSQTIASPDADLDKDGQTSLLEAFLLASRQTQEFYDSDARLATEQALLDDNADGFGTPAAFFRGVRAVKKAASNAAPDGLRAHQFHLVPSDRERNMPADVKARRNALELELAKLRDRKDAMDDAAYYAEVEKLALELAKLYEQIE